MEGLVRLVAESLERHGLTVPPARIDWSDWTPLESGLSLQAPSNPGIFVVAESFVPHNMVQAAEQPKNTAHEASCGNDAGATQAPEWRKTLDGRKTDALGILKIGHTNDLGVEISRLCFHSPLRDRIAAGNCLIRFAAVNDDAQRVSSCAALQQWFTHSISHFPTEVIPAHSAKPQPDSPAPLPSGF